MLRVIGAFLLCRNKKDYKFKFDPEVEIIALHCSKMTKMMQKFTITTHISIDFVICAFIL